MWPTVQSGEGAPSGLTPHSKGYRVFQACFGSRFLTARTARHRLSCMSRIAKVVVPDAPVAKALRALPAAFFAFALAAFAVSSSSSAGQAGASERVSRPFVGVTLTSGVETLPRPIRMHIVNIDLAAPGIRFRLTPRGGPLHTIKQTTLEYLKQQGGQVAINAHFFEPWPAPGVDPGTACLVGIAASDGDVYSPFTDNPPKLYAIGPNAPGLNIGANGRATIVHRNPADANGYAVREKVALHNALAGSEQIVTDGKVTVADSAWNRQLAPRTAIGLTAGQHLILAVVDGRQRAVSEGMTVRELAEMLAGRCGAADVLSLDGGGSTTLAIADPAPRLVNVPVGVNDAPGTQRAVGSSLAVFARPCEPATGPQSVPAGAAGPGGSCMSCPAYWAVVVAASCLAAGLALHIRRRRSRRAARP